MAAHSVENVTATNAAIARAAYEVYMTKDRAAIEELIAQDFHLTIRDRHIVDVEVYFGWPVPHRAPQGGFVDEAEPGTRHH